MSNRGSKKQVMERVLEVLIKAVLRGGLEVVRTRRAGLVEARYKDAKELVTSADERSDAAIRRVFSEELPAIDSEILFELEESGTSGVLSDKRVGADPLDGTNHFAAGGTFYTVQAHYVENGIPLCGVLFQPEAFLPLAETERCVGRLVYAVKGRGVFVEKTELADEGFLRKERRGVARVAAPRLRTYVACVPFSTKMSEDERARTQRVYASGLISASTGVGGAGGNVLLAVFGGQHVYANFGAGVDLDLIPPQVIAEEAGMTVWDVNRGTPVWREQKQPVIFAPNEAIAELFLQAAGL